MVKQAKRDQFNVIQSPWGSGILYALFIAQLRGDTKSQMCLAVSIFKGALTQRILHIFKNENLLIH